MIILSMFSRTRGFGKRLNGEMLNVRAAPSPALANMFGITTFALG